VLQDIVDFILVIKQPLEGFNSTYKICEQSFNEDCATLFI